MKKYQALAIVGIWIGAGIEMAFCKFDDGYLIGLLALFATIVVS